MASTAKAARVAPPTTTVAAPTEFPTMLYRSGNDIVWDGLSLDTRIVTDLDDHTAAAEAGWLTAAEVGSVSP